MKRRRKSHYKKIIIISTIGLLFTLTSGYAAFQTNINITAKGNIKVTPDSCFTVADNGDGTGSITNYDITCGEKVNIPNKINNLTITKIADYAEGTSPVFKRKKVTMVVLPKNLIYIGSSAFSLTNIQTITLPGTVKTISSYAFAYGQLKEITLNEGLETIGWGAFEQNYLTNLKIPSTVKNLKGAIAQRNNLNDEDAYIYARDENGKIDTTRLISYGGPKTNIIIPDGVEIIDGYSLGLSKATTITFPDSVKTIEYHSIYFSSGVQEINIGSGISKIDGMAFSDRNYSSSITININRKTNAVTGSPWGATNANINWTGTK